ncbi:unnamed protein product [Toxocara canis]|uniref:DUF2382 domain-containing protein n=1 Tax=Toxocara canis TaxID=6265 RepID=A0A183UH85_TOXCA|nr:unnamed protein product [Toxocara canis]
MRRCCCEWLCARVLKVNRFQPVVEDPSVLQSTATPSYQTTQEEDEEVPVSEIRTVVRTERHVHDSENGPIVEERTITTTYEDDIAVNEEVVDRIVPLNEEEQEKWDRMVREAQDALERQEPLQSEDGEHREVYQEEHETEDGTIVKTTTVKTSHVTREQPEWSHGHEKQAIEQPLPTHTDVADHVSEASEKGREKQKLSEDEKGHVLESEGSMAQ